MRMRKLCIGIATAALAMPLSAQQVVQHEAVSEPAPVDSTSQTDDIEFWADAHERMTVPVMLSGAGPYRFMVDTGAERTAISRELAGRLNLAYGRRANLHSIAGEKSVGTARLPLLELSRKRVHGIDAPMLERRYMGADGILGVDALRSQRVLFDFRTNILSIVPSPRRNLPVERDAIVITANARKGHLILTEATANDRSINIIIDTGSEVSIANDVLRKRLGLRIAPDAEPETLLSVTGQTMSGHHAIVDKIDIGGAVLRGLSVVFADAHIFRRIGMDRRPTLLLGMDAMRAFDLVSIDFAQKKLRVVLPERSELDGASLATR